MPKTITIRDLDDAVCDALETRARREGSTVSDLLRGEATRLASRPSLDEWLERTRGRSSGIERAEIIAALDEIRGPWPGD
jgi:hypothetical protein